MDDRTQAKQMAPEVGGHQGLRTLERRVYYTEMTLVFPFVRVDHWHLMEKETQLHLCLTQWTD